ncbi:MAG: carcinine hydrolase/isopenicillin-N N-acyltransferase family protein [candidate division WOR-3 bacterium]
MSIRRCCNLILTFSIVISGAAAYSCTIGAFGPSATADGRPILWKNRDVKNPDQEMRYFDRGRYRFIANVYAGETLDVWAGINEAGFAIMNSNSYNIGGRAATGHKPRKQDIDADDGNIMHLALANCSTVDEFASLLDSLNRVGRETPVNFGVFDASGRTAIFEAANTYYRRYDADQESLGILVRANYSYHGDTIRQTGRGRHDRAWQLVAPVARRRQITPEFVMRVLARDMGSVGFDPYPLPFYGCVGELPFGHVPAGSTICRTTTRSAEIMVGPKPGVSPASGMMYVMLGPPETSVPIPLWVNGGPVPEHLDGPERARLCDEAIALRAYTRSEPQYPDAVNTFSLCRVLSAVASAESIIFSRVRQLEAERPEGPGADEAAALTVLSCRLAIESVENFWEHFYSPKSDSAPAGRPNIVPAVSRGSVVISLPEGMHRVRVCDAAGRTVAELVGRSGDTQLVWKPDGLGAGRYFVRFPGAARRAVSFVYIP